MLNYRDFVARKNRQPLIVAHRGAWTTGPENSLLAIRGAFDAGHQIVEIDIQESADGILFLMHDDTLERMTGETGAASDRTMAELASFRLRERDGGSDSAASDEPVPALAQVLAQAEGRGFLDLDVKHPHLIEKVAETAAELGAAARVNVKFPLRTAEDLARLRHIEATTGVMVMPMLRLTVETWADDVARVLESGAVMTEMKFDSLDTLRAAAGQLNAGGTSVWVNTLDPVCSAGLSDSRAAHEPDAIWGVLVEAGASVFQTDIPDLLSAWIKRRGVAA
ncbi:glycerophosphodiester phosphodiesterase family protein [Pannonibacter sp. I15F10I1]|uniref:glycerophosphodiester phosphodiesterase family protein n=1 Tax=Pannonibacter sp. I15F10I1 TaxID=2003580 RepID=UPI001645545F|nr:glycerophosphodiester phosphodiesterase family protein [Pannonibacter sp. I15F10I1]